MREIKIRVLRDAFQQFAGPRAAQLVPSHVREAIHRRQRGNFLRKQREPGVSGRFVTRGKHGLEAETNSQQWGAARHSLAQRIHQGTLAERTHERTKMADAGKDQSVAVCKSLRRGCAARIDAEPRERTLNRRKVSCSVFHERDIHRRPFVLGSTRFSCGSRVAAKRSALANALKIAST